jgi:hypothetical protein
MPGRPTPTQDELNKIALGEHVELAEDGSGPDPTAQANAEAQKKITRQGVAERTTAPHTTQHRARE